MATQGVEEEIVLQLDFEPGEHANAIVAAEALIAWIEAAKAASDIVDPGNELRVDLVSAEQACLKLRTIFRFVEDKVIGPPADFLDEFPRIKKLVVATAIGIPAGLAIVVGEHVMFPDPPSSLSPEGQQIYHEKAKEVGQSSAVQSKNRTFFRTLEKQPGISQVRVSEGKEERPLLEVPRSEFSTRGGLFSDQQEQEQERTQVKEWDVVLTHPALVSKPETWKFLRESLPLSAKMEDNAVLLAIREGRLPLQFREGEPMRVRIEWREVLKGKVWEPVPRTRKITKVLSPEPLATPAPPVDPKNDH